MTLPFASRDPARLVADPSVSPTAHLLDELQLYGFRPDEGEPDPRPLPDAERAAGAVADMADAVIATLAETRLEPETPELLWSLVNLFHRAIERAQRRLDRNEDAQRLSQGEQDGSEVRSVDLERLTAEGLSLTERRNTYEFLRETAAEHYERHTGRVWHPASSSSRVTHGRALTAAVIDSREFLAAKRRSETEARFPAGARIAFTGGVDCNAHDLIWSRLDKARNRHADMVLLHGGGNRGAERIAACWADTRKVPQVVFQPDWKRHRNAAPFKRNDQLLEALPIGLIAFPGSGVSENLVDKARKMGIPVWAG